MRSWVDLPEPSIPSKVTKRPRLLRAVTGRDSRMQATQLAEPAGTASVYFVRPPKREPIERRLS